MFVADLHNDLVQRVIEGEDVTKLTSHGHTDIPRLLKSEIDLEILIIWVSSNAKEPNFFKRADKMYDEIERISSHEEIIIPKKISDINEAIDKNKTMLPIPMLDGGHLVYYTYEMIFGNELPLKFQMAAQFVGIALLGLIMIIAFYNDFVRIFS